MNDSSINIDQTKAIPDRKSKLLRWGLGIASVMFVSGLFLPMITISKFVIVKNSFSVVSGALELLNDGQLLLFLIVAGFSVVIPIMKIYVLYRLLSSKITSSHNMKRYLYLMHEYGRWAMLDVMVVAILIVTVKLGAIASVQVHVGLFLFGAAVLLIMLITNEITRLTN
jgi:paraquat-inducible protein A